MHTIRQVINNDSLFRKILRGLNKDFYHKTVDSRDVEAWFSKQAGKDLSKIFDQYLRNTKIPVLEYKVEGDNLSYRWANCIEGFNMPVRLAGTTDNWLKPSTEWNVVTMTATMKDRELNVDPAFYILVKKVN